MNSRPRLLATLKVKNEAGAGHNATAHANGPKRLSAVSHFPKAGRIKMIKVSAGSGEYSEAALREHLDAMVQTNKGKPIRDVTIKQSFER